MEPNFTSNLTRQDLENLKISQFDAPYFPLHTQSCERAVKQVTEAAAAALCLPSPACSDRLGQVIRGAQVVDLFGESVLCTITTGDHYRKRHDSYKMKLLQMCQWAGVDAEVEVFSP